MRGNQQILTMGEWTLRLRVPEGDGPHPVMLLLHGWTGDENVMWVFANRLPEHYLMIAPRGLYPAPGGGYGWHPHQEGSWPWVDDFSPSIEALLDLLTPEHFSTGDFSQLRLVGFSQGAALSYAFSMTRPRQVISLAGLSGFLPEGADALARNRPLLGKAIFVAHGTQDERVPVSRARQAVELLGQAGASVTYCEDDVGHKLSATCFRGLESFFADESH